jgi:hypothetical protein
VRYEELVTGAEQELRRVCAFLAEEYSPAMLAPNANPPADLPWYRRAEQPLTTGRVGKWRELVARRKIPLLRRHRWRRGCVLSAANQRPQAGASGQLERPGEAGGNHRAVDRPSSRRFTAGVARRRLPGNLRPRLGSAVAVTGAKSPSHKESCPTKRNSKLQWLHFGRRLNV